MNPEPKHLTVKGTVELEDGTELNLRCGTGDIEVVANVFHTCVYGVKEVNFDITTD